MSTLRFMIWIMVRVMVRFSGTVSVKVRVRVSVNFRVRGTVKVRGTLWVRVRDSGMLVLGLDVGLPSLQLKLG